MFIATSLSHYKRPEVRKAIALQAENKEVSVMFGLEKFGKRPDVISYDNDVLEFAKKKVTSFHCSEELWHNPLSITTGMSRKDLDELRIGWDLILDIDCPDWDISRLIAHLFVKALKDHGVKSITAKFSGNKGFHIAVPFQAFPTQVFFDGEIKDTKDLFPEAPRKIALYLLSYITEHYAKVNNDSETVSLDNNSFSFSDLKKVSAKGQSVIAYRCLDCKKLFDKLPPSTSRVYQCDRCGYLSNPKGFPEIIKCEKCFFPVNVKYQTKHYCPHCKSSTFPEKLFNLLAVVEVDTVLLASRHLYRMPYSLHEKSKLVSVPVALDSILSFDKSSAIPENISFDISFLERSSAYPEETADLVREALSKDLIELKHIHADIDIKEFSKVKVVSLPDTAIPEEFFPPCMKNILLGLEDGKKRALFSLINFLRVSGWSYDEIKDRIYKWNEQNPEPLRETYLKGQLAQIKKNKQPLPPTNCASGDHYTSLQVCKPDNFCPRIKNPAMYAKKQQELAARKTSKRKKTPNTTKKTNKKQSKNKKE